MTRPTRRPDPARPCEIRARAVVGRLGASPVYRGVLRCDDDSLRACYWIGDRPDRAMDAAPAGMVAVEARPWGGE